MPFPSAKPIGLDALLEEIHRRGLEALDRILGADPSHLFEPEAPRAGRPDWEPVAVNFVHLAELCGTETTGHLVRVQRYVRIIVRDLKGRPDFPEIDPLWEERTVRASVLHDLGKVAVPPGILLKPGPLSASERQIMKLHVPLGAESLEAMRLSHPGAEFWALARDIAATHHERQDGSGYPHGLKGEEVPLAGRIVALVDVYDAITSKRVYKSAMPHEDARDVVCGQAGGQFDHRVVEAFLRNEGAFREVVDKFRD